jgi:hypothetical protein
VIDPSLLFGDLASDSIDVALYPPAEFQESVLLFLQLSNPLHTVSAQFLFKLLARTFKTSKINTSLLQPTLKALERSKRVRGRYPVEGG